MKSKIILLTLLILCASAFSLNAQEKRGFLLGVSLGYAIPTYNDPLGYAMDIVESDPLIDRLALGLGLEIGYAVTLKTYIILGFDGVGDRLYDSYDWIQENSYLFFAGIKVYPLGTGLTFSLKGGASRMVEMTSETNPLATFLGYGFGATLGYDFDKTRRGFTAEIGVGYNYLGGITLQNSNSTAEITVSQFVIYGKLLIK